MNEATTSSEGSHIVFLSTSEMLIH